MRRFAAILIPVLLVLALAMWRVQGPAAKPESAPANEFSASRAMTVLRTLLAEGVPHPIGSAANARVRDRIVARFRSLGYQTSVQRRFACNAMPACGTVENILARPPGATGDLVLLAAHYDSVGAGPGASDDGVGVASLLEIARAVRGERARNPIAFLVTDGEEGGLLGAEAFVADRELSRDAKVVVNVENRGTYGPSNMFETSARNAWLIRHLARGLEHPHASSFFQAVYNLLPNDTDVTVFKREGKAAVNFAAIRGVQWYHTPLDDVAHASARTMQHHGENLLGTARQLAAADLDARSRDDAAYFDLLGFTLIRWPARATIWLTAISLVLLIAGIRNTNPRAMTFGVLATFTAILLALLAGMGVSWLARLRTGGVNWVAYPLPSILTMVLTGIAAALCAAAIFRRRSEERALLYGAALVWHAIAFVLALTLTGASFLFLVPAIAVTICALTRATETMTSSIAATAAAIVFSPLVLLLYDALGGRMMVAIAILIGTIATLIAPLFARCRNAAAAFGLALVCVAIALLLPISTPAHPRAISLAYVDDAAAPPVWTTPVLTPALSQAARFAAGNPSLRPWTRSALFTAPAPKLPMPRVEVTATRQGDRVLVMVRSPRHAKRLTLIFLGGTVARVNGLVPPPRPARFRQPESEWRFTSADGAEELIAEIQAPGLLRIVASDVTHGLPQGGEPLARARNASNAVPIHEGDLTITRSRLTIK